MKQKWMEASNRDILRVLSRVPRNQGLLGQSISQPDNKRTASSPGRFSLALEVGCPNSKAKKKRPGDEVVHFSSDSIRNKHSLGSRDPKRIGRAQ